jgi:hypothetical protein
MVRTGETLKISIQWKSSLQRHFEVLSSRRFAAARHG